MNREKDLSIQGTLNNIISHSLLSQSTGSFSFLCSCKGADPFTPVFGTTFGSLYRGFSIGKSTVSIIYIDKSALSNHTNVCFPFGRFVSSPVRVISISNLFHFEMRRTHTSGYTEMVSRLLFTSGTSPTIYCDRPTGVMVVGEHSSHSFVHRLDSDWLSFTLACPCL